MVRRLLKSGKNKNFTLRLEPDVSDEIRARASDLRMSQSYYMTALFKLEVKYDLLNEFPDPLAVAEAEAEAEAEAIAEDSELDPDEASAMIERFKRGGFLAENTNQGYIDEPDPIDAKGSQKPSRQRPKMRTPQDLMRISQQGGNPAAVKAVLSGDIGGEIRMNIRNAQLKAVREEMEERQMRKRMLDGIQEEQKLEEQKLEALEPEPNQMVEDDDDEAS